MYSNDWSETKKANEPLDGIQYTFSPKIDKNLLFVTLILPPPRKREITPPCERRKF